MCQVGEMCGGGNRYGVEGSLGHGWLRTPWRTLGSHQHHRGVGLCRVVRWHHTGLHMGLNVKESQSLLVCVCVCVRDLQPQCQCTWPCWVACGKPPKHKLCNLTQQFSLGLYGPHKHTETLTQLLLCSQVPLCHGLSKHNCNEINLWSPYFDLHDQKVTDSTRTPTCDS